MGWPVIYLRRSSGALARNILLNTTLSLSELQSLEKQGNSEKRQALDSSYRHSHPLIGRCIAHLATQRELGLLSGRRARSCPDHRADLGAVRPYLITALRRRAFQRTGARWRYRRFARHGKSMKLLVAATVGRTSVRNCGAGLSFPSEALRRGQSRSPACGSSPFSRFGRS
jgi:hypothetical protein